MKSYALDCKDLDVTCSKDLNRHLIKQIKSFELTAHYLDIADVKIEAIKNDYKDSEELKRMKMLQVWKESKGSNATYLALAEAFIQMDSKEVAEFIVKYVKEIKAIENDLDDKQRGNYKVAQPSIIYLINNYPCPHGQRVQYLLCVSVCLSVCLCVLPQNCCKLQLSQNLNKLQVTNLVI